MRRKKAALSCGCHYRLPPNFLSSIVGVHFWGRVLVSLTYSTSADNETTFVARINAVAYSYIGKGDDAGR